MGSPCLACSAVQCLWLSPVCCAVLCCAVCCPVCPAVCAAGQHPQGVTSWFVFYLIKEKGVADAAQAAVRVSGLELGGLVGSLIAGRLSDMMINNSKKGEGAVGKRVQVRGAFFGGRGELGA